MFPFYKWPKSLFFVLWLPGKAAVSKLNYKKILHRYNSEKRYKNSFFISLWGVFRMQNTCQVSVCYVGHPDMKGSTEDMRTFALVSDSLIYLHYKIGHRNTYRKRQVIQSFSFKTNLVLAFAKKLFPLSPVSGLHDVVSGTNLKIHPLHNKEIYWRLRKKKKIKKITCVITGKSGSAPACRRSFSTAHAE